MYSHFKKQSHNTYSLYFQITLDLTCCIRKHLFREYRHQIGNKYQSFWEENNRLLSFDTTLAAQMKEAFNNYSFSL
jgi:hypothetical protein